jgi:hypothetical protein
MAYLGALRPHLLGSSGLVLRTSHYGARSGSPRPLKPAGPDRSRNGPSPYSSKTCLTKAHQGHSGAHHTQSPFHATSNNCLLTPYYLPQFSQVTSFRWESIKGGRPVHLSFLYLHSLNSVSLSPRAITYLGIGVSFGPPFPVTFSRQSGSLENCFKHLRSFPVQSMHSHKTTLFFDFFKTELIV